MRALIQSIEESRSVVIAGLEEIDAVFTDEIDDSVLFRQASRPRAGREILQRLRLANPFEGVSKYGLNKS